MNRVSATNKHNASSSAADPQGNSKKPLSAARHQRQLSPGPSDRQGVNTFHKPRSVRANNVAEEKHVDEDVRLIEEESSHLHNISLSHARNASAQRIDVTFPPTSAGFSTHSAYESYPDTSQALPTSETPLIKRNKELRAVQGRRHSGGARGKRLSSSLGNSGVIGK